MKKILCVLLVLITVFSFPAAAFAESVASPEGPVEASPRVKDGDTGYINRVGVRLRSTAGIPSDDPDKNILGQLDYRALIYFAGNGGYADGHYWTKITVQSGSNSGRTGYVASEYITWGYPP